MRSPTASVETFQCSENRSMTSDSAASYGRFPMKTLLGSVNFLVPGRPAFWRRSLFSSIRCEDLDERFRLMDPETFIVRSDDDDDDGDDDEVAAVMMWQAFEKKAEEDLDERSLLLFDVKASDSTTTTPRFGHEDASATTTATRTADVVVQHRRGDVLLRLLPLEFIMVVLVMVSRVLLKMDRRGVVAPNPFSWWPRRTILFAT
mmetsp:Transcript_3203/g.8182  ORF Transcript_3203/g.8182 Transcript_3203/m.8182 type:complete len:204 (+) Transcript_3203:1008-1619(+)